MTRHVLTVATVQLPPSVVTQPAQLVASVQEKKTDAMHHVRLVATVYQTPNVVMQHVLVDASVQEH